MVGLVDELALRFSQVRGSQDEARIEMRNIHMLFSEIRWIVKYDIPFDELFSPFLDFPKQQPPIDPLVLFFTLFLFFLGFLFLFVLVVLCF